MLELKNVLVYNILVYVSPVFIIRAEMHKKALFIYRKRDMAAGYDRRSPSAEKSVSDSFAG